MSAAPKLLGTTSPSWHLARRACIGADVQVEAEIRRRGAAAWIDAQLKPAAIDDSLVEDVIAKHYPAATMATNAQIRDWTSGRPWESAQVLQRVTMLRQTLGNRHLLESMTEFLSDQIFVNVLGKGDSFVLHFNEQVLRPGALGRFADLLKKVLRHPALLVYLNNDRSTKTAPNENLGRELLELHTVGVGSHTETDVKDLARLLTGRGVDWSTLGYKYDYTQHATGRVSVVGWSHPNSGTSTSYNDTMISSLCEHLAKHPATARRLMQRMAVRFVSDAPPAALVDRMVAEYLRAGTSLAAPLRLMLLSAEFNAATKPGTKVRRGQEQLAAMVRLRQPTGFVPDKDPRTNPYGNMGTLTWLLGQTGHGVRAWPYVNGYPDTADHWLNGESLRAMDEMANAVSSGWATGMRWPELGQAVGVVPGLPVLSAANALTLRATGWNWAWAERMEVAKLLWDGGASDIIPPDSARVTDATVRDFLPRALRLVLSSPYMWIR